MNALTILRRLLIEDSDVAAAVDTRVYPVSRTQSDPLPALVIHSVYEDQDIVLAGARQGFENRMSVECIAGSAGAAHDLGEAVKSALQCIIHQPLYSDDSPPVLEAVATIWKEGSDSSDFTEEPRVFRRIVDFRMRWTR